MPDATQSTPFSDQQHRLLARMIDEIIPPSADGHLPGAGDAGVTRYIEAALRDTPLLTDMIVESLAGLEALAQQRHAQSFLALPRAQQSELVQALAMSEHALPPVVMIHTFAGYYQAAGVLQALGLESRPPHPKGYAMEPNDLSLLDPVRQRPRRYREDRKSVV